MRCKIILILVILSLLIAAIPGWPESGNDRREVLNLRQDISLLNLVNGLYLNKAQMETYLDILIRYEKLQKDFERKMETVLREQKRAFAQLKKVLIANQGIDKETERNAQMAKEKGKELEKEHFEALMALEDELKRMLTQNQLDIIADFKPCLIPPKNLRDPSRVGQASGDTYGAEAWLERLYRIPAKRFNRVQEKFLQKYIERLKDRMGLMTEEQEKAERERVMAIFQKARQLSRVDFEIHKAELAKELLQPFEAHQPLRGNRLGKVGKFLLNTRLIPVLKERIAHAKG